MKQYKWYQISLIVLFSIFVNFIGRFFADTFQLPLWLDSFGTFLTAYILGPVCGIMVGVAGNIIHGLSHPVSFAYAFSSVAIGITVGYCSKKGWLENLLKTMSLAMLVTVICSFMSCLVDIIFYDGKIGNIWGQAVSDYFENIGIYYFFRVLLGQFYVDFLDKVVTLLLLHFFIKIYKKLSLNLPGFLKPLSTSSILGILFSSLIFLCPSELTAEDFKTIGKKDYNSYIRTIYNKENGLPSGKTNAIAETRDGVLWIGTYEGLYRFNGNEFKFMDNLDSIKTVRSLFVDNENRLFVGTNDDGISVLINEKVTGILDEDSGLPNNSVRCITRGSNNLYYVGTSGAMAVLSIEDGLKVKKTFPQIEGVICIDSDENGNIAAVTYDGKLFILNGTKIIELRKNELFTSVTFSNDGIIYASTENSQIRKFKIQKNYDAYNVIPVDFGNEISCPDLRHINSLYFYDDVLFVAADNGIGYFFNNNFEKIETGSFNNSVDNVLIDFQENLWFTSSRLGLLKMCKSQFSEIYLSAGFQEVVVNSIASFEGNLYFATDEGLSAVDSETGKAVSNELTEYLKKIRVRCLLTSKDNCLWICTKSKGLICVDSSGKIIKVVQNHQARVVKELRDGTIVVGANDGIGFIKDFQILKWFSDSDGLETPMILTINQTKDDVVFAGTDGGGICVFKIIEGEWIFEQVLNRKNGLSSNVVLRTVNDFDGSIETGNFFAVTSNGICYIIPSGDEYQIRYLANFPYTNNYDMVISNDKSVFVLGSAGIFEVNRNELLSGEKLEYNLLDLKKGLRGSLTANSWNYIDEKNNLYLSCDSGASCINLDTFDKDENSYRIQLKSVLIDDENYYLQKDAPCVISPEKERLEIFPEVINYSISNPLVSVYLEGVDEKPQIIPQKSLTSFVYTHIEPGVYNFHIGILNEKGTNVVEEAVYVFQKQSHFYDYLWFKFYLIIVAAIAIAWLTWYLTFNIQSKRIEKQQKEIDDFKKQVRMVNETIFTFANSVEARDKSTGRHSLRVADYSVLIAKEIGYSDVELENLHKIGLLHDIGKIGVPDSILNKPDKLTDYEYQIMKTHVDIGGEILKDFTLVPNVVEGAKYHHERFDGKGYPNGLKGEQIPLNARIIGIADAFDAMTANRVYRKAQNLSYVVDELKRCKGSQFDPVLVDVLLRLIENDKIKIEAFS